MTEKYYKDKTRWRWKDWKVNFEITHIDGEVYTFEEDDLSESDRIKLMTIIENYLRYGGAEDDRPDTPDTDSIAERNYENRRT